MVFFFLFITSDSGAAITKERERREKSIDAMPSSRHFTHRPGRGPPRQIAEATTEQQKMLFFCARSIQYRYSNDRNSNLISPTAVISY